MKHKTISAEFQCLPPVLTGSETAACCKAPLLEQLESLQVYLVMLQAVL